MKKKILGILLCIILIVTAILPLAVSKNIIKPDNPYKLDLVDQKQDQQDGFEYLWKDYQFAQSFKPSLPKLTKIYLNLLRLSQDGSTITVSIRENLDGTDLVTMSISSADVKPEKQWVWVEFDFDDIKVNPESTYYIVVASNDENPYFDYVAWGWHGGNPYQRGESYTRYLSQSWEENPDNDFCFQTYGAKPKLRESKSFFEKFPILYQIFQKLFIEIKKLVEIF